MKLRKLGMGLVASVAVVLQHGNADPPQNIPVQGYPSIEPTPMQWSPRPIGAPLPPPPASYPRDQTLGEIIDFGGDFAPAGWVVCDGAMVSVAQNPQLYSLLGTTFGATKAPDGTVTGFKLPDLPRGAGLPLPLISVDGYYPRPDEAVPTADMIGAISLMPDGGVALPANMVPCRGQLLASEDELTQGLFATFGTSFGPPAGDGGTFQMPTLPAPARGLQFAMTTTGTLAPAAPLGNHVLGEIRGWPASAVPPRGWRACNGAALNVNFNSALFSIVGARFGGDGTATFKLPALPDVAGVRRIMCVEGQYPVRD